MTGGTGFTRQSAAAWAELRPGRRTIDPSGAISRMTRSVLVGLKRSPMGRFLGSLSTLSAPQIGAQVARDLIKDVTCPAADVDLVLVGQVLQAGVGQNPARQVALGAGLPDTVTCITLNQVCGSALQAVMTADNNIRLGDCRIVLAGGIESMSGAPHLLRGMRTGAVKFGEVRLEDEMMTDGLSCPFEHWRMGDAADWTAKKYGVSRADQDAFAVASHQRAAKARQAGVFKKFISPIEIKSKKGVTLFDADETIREEVTLEALAALKPAFSDEGTVTAGNASQITDGAAMVLVASEDEAARRGWAVRARIISHTTFGVPPKELFLAPVGAVRSAVQKAGLKLADVDLFEINEAFAAQMVACMRGLEIPHEKVNVLGGGIALGHPIGASGARCLVTLINAMEERGARRGVVSLCLGGGNAVAMVVERP